MTFLQFFGIAISLLNSCVQSSDPQIQQRLKIRSDPGLFSLVRPAPDAVVQDRSHYYVLLDSSIRKLDRKSLKVVATGNPYDLSYFHTLPNKEHLLLPNVNVTLKFHYEDVRQALKILFRNTNASYSLAPDVTGKVTASLANVPLGKALPFLLKQVECTFHVEGGVVLILKGLHPTFHLYQEKVTAHSIANDGDWILLFFGKEIFKFSKKRMRTEEVIRY